MVWGLQFGSVDGDTCNGATTDAAGNVYVVGMTHRWIDGERAPLAWVIKFDDAGQRLWRRLLKKPLFNAVGIAADATGNVVVTGTADFDAFAAKYDKNGRLLWWRHLGSAGDFDASNAVAIDVHGNVYIAGETYGSLAGRYRGEEDAFLAKYDADGRLQWKRQLGTRCYDIAKGIAVDGDGNALVGGYTCGWLAAPPQGADSFLAKYDPDGRQLWRRQFGSTGDEVTYGVATDAHGNTVLCGYTDGPLGGPNIGGSDGWIAEYDSTGAQVWARLIGTVDTDQVFACATNASGDVFAAGGTDGDLDGPNAGPRDAFVAKYPGD